MRRAASVIATGVHSGAEVRGARLRPPLQHAAAATGHPWAAARARMGGAAPAADARPCRWAGNAVRPSGKATQGGGKNKSKGPTGTLARVKAAAGAGGATRQRPQAAAAPPRAPQRAQAGGRRPAGRQGGRRGKGKPGANPSAPDPPAPSNPSAAGTARLPAEEVEALLTGIKTAVERRNLSDVARAIDAAMGSMVSVAPELRWSAGPLVTTADSGPRPRELVMPQLSRESLRVAIVSARALRALRVLKAATLNDSCPLPSVDAMSTLVRALCGGQRAPEAAYVLSIVEHAVGKDISSESSAPLAGFAAVRDLAELMASRAWGKRPFELSEDEPIAARPWRAYLEMREAAPTLAPHDTRRALSLMAEYRADGDLAWQLFNDIKAFETDNPPLGIMVKLMEILADLGEADRVRHIEQLCRPRFQKPNAFPYVLVLKALANCTSSTRADVHAAITDLEESGIPIRYRGYSAILRALASVGDFESCQKWLRRMEKDTHESAEVTAVQYNLLVSAARQSGDVALALRVLAQMLKDGPTPTHYTFGTVLAAVHQAAVTNAQKYAQAVREGRDTSSHALGIEQSPVPAGSKVECSACSSVLPDAVVQDAAMSSKCPSCGLRASLSVMAAVGTQGMGISSAVSIAHAAVAHGLPLPEAMAHNLVQTVLKVTETLAPVNRGAAHSAFGYLQNELVPLFKAAKVCLRQHDLGVIVGYLASKQLLFRATELMRLMLDCGSKPDIVMFSELLKACHGHAKDIKGEEASLGSDLSALSHPSAALDSGAPEDVDPSWADVVTADADSALDVTKLAIKQATAVNSLMIRSGVRPNRVYLNSLINVFATRGRVREVNDILETMRRLPGCEPDIVTFNTVIKGYARYGLLDKIREVHTQMSAAGVEPDRYTVLHVVHAYLFHDDTDTAAALLPAGDELGDDKYQRLYNIFLRGSADASDVHFALDVYRRGREKRTVPMRFDSLQALLHACARAGMMHEAEEVFAAEWPLIGDTLYEYKQTTLIVTMVRGWLANGDLGRAAEWDERLVSEFGLRRTGRTTTPRVVAYFRAGEPDKALDLYHAFLAEGGLATRALHDVLIRGCLLSKRHESALDVLRSMGEGGMLEGNAFVEGDPVDISDEDSAKRSALPSQERMDELLLAIKDRSGLGFGPELLLQPDVQLVIEVMRRHGYRLPPWADSRS